MWLGRKKAWTWVRRKSWAASCTAWKTGARAPKNQNEPMGKMKCNRLDVGLGTRLRSLVVGCVTSDDALDVSETTTSAATTSSAATTTTEPITTLTVASSTSTEPASTTTPAATTSTLQQTSTTPVVTSTTAAVTSTTPGLFASHQANRVESCNVGCGVGALSNVVSSCEQRVIDGRRDGRTDGRSACTRQSSVGRTRATPRSARADWAVDWCVAQFVCSRRRRTGGDSQSGRLLVDLLLGLRSIQPR
jgi:hypothetical protein